MITIAQIIDTSYYNVLNFMAGNRSWPDDELEKAYQDDRLAIEEQPTHVGARIEATTTPISWTAFNEIKQYTENQKIGLATALLENAIDSHSYQLTLLLGSCDKLIVYLNHRYELVSGPEPAPTNMNVKFIYTTFTREGWKNEQQKLGQD